jgi:hypothetical protein
MKKIIMIVIALFMFVPLLVAQEALVWNPKGLTWDHNTETDLAGYFIYESSTPGDPEHGTYFISIPAGTNVFEFPTNQNYAEGIFYWVTTAYDVAGNESGFSNQVTAGFDHVPPAPPVGCKAYK